MGLDMYLEKRNFVGNKYRKPADMVKIQTPKTEKDQSFSLHDIDAKKVSYIIEEVGYWRKANAIHKWFVNNVQNGNDDCKQHYTHAEQLQELLNICEDIQENCKLIDGEVNNGYTVKDGKKIFNKQKGKLLSKKDSQYADNLLPTEEGFFFGSTDYDEWYMDDIAETIQILTPLVKDTGADFYYQSSW